MNPLTAVMSRWQAAFQIVIGQRKNYLLYLLLPYRQRARFMAPDSDHTLDRINAAENEVSFSGTRADYDRVHAYGTDAQTEYPASTLLDIWAEHGYGRVLDIGAGSGYFTERIARRAVSVHALEPVADLQRVITDRCRERGLSNVEVVGIPALDAAARFPEASFDTVFLLHALHHFHRREELFRMLGRLVRPGGRLLILEPHHNVRRVLRLVQKYRHIYRPRRVWTEERHWATHHFLAVGELRWLCRIGGFVDVKIAAHWLPGLRRAFGDDVRRRCRIERMLGRLPGLRHLGSELALEARRRD